MAVTVGIALASAAVGTSAARGGPSALEVSSCDSIAPGGGRVVLRPKGDFLYIEGINGGYLREADRTIATVSSLLGGRMPHYYKTLSLPAGRHVVWVRASRPGGQTYSLQGVVKAAGAGAGGAPPALVSSMVQQAEGPSLQGETSDCLVTFVAEAGHDYTLRIVGDEVVIRDDATRKVVSRHLRCKPTKLSSGPWPSFGDSSATQPNPSGGR